MISIAAVVAATYAQSEPGITSAVADHRVKLGIAANGLAQRMLLSCASFHGWCSPSSCVTERFGNRLYQVAKASQFYKALALDNAFERRRVVSESAKCWRTVVE